MRDGLHAAFAQHSVTLKRQEAAYKDFAAQTGAAKTPERLSTAGFGRSVSGKAREAADNTYRQEMRSIGAYDAAPKTLAKRPDMRYNCSPDEKLLTQYEQDVKTGWVSPLSGFANYKALYNRIETEIVGNTVANGTIITGQVPHFMQRVIGTLVDPKKLKEDLQIIRRSGVEVEAIEKALFESESIGPVLTHKTGQHRVKLIGKKCAVSVNPDTGMLIQVNPL